MFIVKFKNYPASHVAVLLTTMTDNIACQQQQQNDRYNIYKLFEALFENFNTGMYKKNKDLIFKLQFLNFRINFNGS